MILFHPDFMARKTMKYHKDEPVSYTHLDVYKRQVEDDTNRDIFVHVTGLGGLTIRENDRVEYEVVEGKKGLNAVQVSKI